MARTSPRASDIAAEQVEAIIAAVLKSGKVAITDLVELNPTFDIDGRGARTAGRLAWLVAKNWPVMAAEREPEE